MRRVGGDQAWAVAGAVDFGQSFSHRVDTQTPPSRGSLLLVDDPRLTPLKTAHGRAGVVVAQGREVGLTGKVGLSSSRFALLVLAP